ncbi:uncharacterized protein LOC126572973 [Anopheles aquasalis]|uniref:uncharacterized protein LOC126572973 n=1 Tax=Anopheles aquasalis TaxID=42839 RepID=UPI00215A8424|nr:uncharacterized protein LOC126572973 [Anopheles aquasalis]
MQEDDELFLLEDEYPLRGGSPPGVAGASADFLGSAGSVTSPISTGSALLSGETPDWWRCDSMFTDETVDELLEAKCRTMATSGNHSVTTGERLTMDRRKAVDVYRNEINTASFSSDAEASIIVHEDICNKSIRSSDSSSSSSSSTTTCTTTKFSTGERCSEAAAAAAAATVRGDCSNSIGAVSAPEVSVAGAVVKMSVDQQQQQQLKSSSYSCSSSSSSNGSSSTSSNSSSGGMMVRGSCGITTEEELDDEVEKEEVKKARMQALRMLNKDTTTTQHLPELMHWTNETCVNNGLFADDVLSDQLWISAPINGTHLRQDQPHHHQPHFTEPPGVAVGGVLDAYGTTTIDHYAEPKISPISLHDEIEQLSATWDCDVASNHLASAPPFAALHYTSITADDPMLCAVSSPVPISESVSLNMLRWLEEDISSSFDNQQPQPLQPPQPPGSDHGPGLAPPEPQTPLKTNDERPQAAGQVSVFGQSLDLVQNIFNLSPDNQPPESTNQSQRDHNYFTVKRSHSGSVGHSELPRKRLRQTTDREEVEKGERQAESNEEECREATRKPSDTKRAKRENSASKMYAATNTTTSTISAGSTTVAATTTMNTRFNTTTSAATDLDTPSAPQYTTRPPAGKDKRRPAAMALRLDVSAQPPRSNGGSNLNLPHNPVSTLTVDTPDLTNDILDLEDEKFDLLSFIDATPAEENSLELKNLNSRRNPEGLNCVTSTLPSVGKQEEDGKKIDSTVEAEFISLTPSMPHPLYHLLTIDTLNQLTEATGGLAPSSDRYQADQDSVRAGSRSSASSVYGGDSSSDVSFSSSKPPKRRGRPPKTPGGTVRDRSAYQHLSEADWRYREQRDKNNEASRKSRINRKDRELKLEAEADELSEKHRKLSFDEKRLQRECQKWRKAVMKLALL